MFKAVLLASELDLASQGFPSFAQEGVATWITGQVLEHKSVSLLKDHNLTTPSRDTARGFRECRLQGNTGTFVPFRASSVSLFWLVADASVIQDAVTSLVTSFIVNDSSLCCERHG